MPPPSEDFDEGMTDAAVLQNEDHVIRGFNYDGAESSTKGTTDTATCVEANNDDSLEHNLNNTVTAKDIASSDKTSIEPRPPRRSKIRKIEKSATKRKKTQPLRPRP
jgi:hypothetical protein